MGNSIKGLGHKFAENESLFPENNALFVNNNFYTYKKLRYYAEHVAFAISQTTTNSDSLVGFLGYRSIGAYSSILGILWAGCGYVPLNPTHPVERLAKIIELSGVATVFVCTESVPLLTRLSPLLTTNIVFIIVDIFEDEPSFNTINPEIKNVSIKLLSLFNKPDKPINQPVVDENDIAFLLFTSGSTGVPKGVPVLQGNVFSYFEYICKRYSFNQNDRIAQNSEMTFDVSVLEMFSAWNSGACLYCVPKSTLLLPAKFIKDHNITVWISVPSIGIFMDRMRLLKPGIFPSIRLCILLGEPVPVKIAQKWQSAAPDARVEIHYGPTETTISITHYLWDNENSPNECINGIVPIGVIFPRQSCVIVDSQLKPVPPEIQGELLLAGDQVFNGYFRNDEKTKNSFVTLPCDSRRWYKSGDITIMHANGVICCLGRVDFQVKILGNRVELQEIEHTLMRICDQDQAIAIPLPYGKQNAEKVVGVVGVIVKLHEEEIIEKCKQILPAYMVPSSIFFIDEFPHNDNGKIDRLELGKLIQRRIDESHQ